MFLILLVIGLFWCSLAVAFLAWEKLVYAMLVFLSFSGAVELWLPHIVWTRELTDIFFVIPKGRPLKRQNYIPSHLIQQIALDFQPNLAVVPQL